MKRPFLLFTFYFFIAQLLVAQDSLAIENFENTYVLAPCYINDNLLGYESSELIEDKLSCIENKVKLEYNVYTGGFINYFAHRKRSYVTTMLERKSIYFPMIEQKLQEANLPDELKYLSIIESGLNPRAQSNAGAVGLWQFILQPAV